MSRLSAGPAASLVLVILLWPGPAALALESIRLSLGRLEGPAWRLEGASLKLTALADSRADLALDVEGLVLPAPLDQVQALALRCPGASLGPGRSRCESGSLRLETRLLDRQDMKVSFEVDHATGRLTLAVRDVVFADGGIELDGEMLDGEWQVRVRAHRLALSRLLARLPHIALPEGVSASGRLSLSGEASGGQVLRAFSMDGRLRGLALSDGTGLREGEGMDLAFSARAGREAQAWRFRTSADLKAGQVYVDPHYLEVQGAPLHLSAGGRWDPGTRRLDVHQLEYRHPGVLGLTGSLVASRGVDLQFEEVVLDLEESSVAGLYPVYLQPLVMDGLLDLESAGHVSGQVSWRRDGPVQAVLHMADVYLDEVCQEGTCAEGGLGRIGLYGVNGTLRWGAPEVAGPSSIQWAGGHIYRIAFGGAELEAIAQGRNIRLTRPLQVPFLDGSLSIDALAVMDLDTPDLRWRFQGLLKPVSMGALTRALGWPPWGGSLSGVIPVVSYQKGRVSVEGALLVRAFDGEIVIYDLSLDRPLGLVPELKAQVDIRNLSLDKLTRAFSFGKIQGRLGGYVRGLRLEDWQPAAFDARLQTPPEDSSRHRISQRAVENLASLGGAGGALSRGLMRFFNEFSYDRLGLACRLRNEVCEMDGVAPAQRGYYIVKGGGLPRIDVVGFSRRVDWNTLIQRLQDATAAGAPVVE